MVATPDRRRNRRVCHINMLKPYYPREATTLTCQSDYPEVENPSNEVSRESNESVTLPLNNSRILSNLDEKLCHLTFEQREDMSKLITQHKETFKDTPGRTNVVCHDIDIGSESPIKQHPYRLNPRKLYVARKEIEYMLNNDLAEPCQSNWNSPIVLHPKPDHSYRLCIDYRKINKITKSDSFPIPRIEDCIDRIGQSKFLSKYDL